MAEHGTTRVSTEDTALVPRREQKEMLDAYDRARTPARSHEVETHHGRVAEAAFRKWLTEFLPKRYGVTSGYIVSQFVDDTARLPHYDVIIYDQMEAPVLWVEGHADASVQGQSRALPVEHVRGVIEVKSTFGVAAAGDAVRHLDDLKPLLADLDPPSKFYKRYLPATFVSLAVFFELRMGETAIPRAIDEVLPREEMRGYSGALVLRGDDYSLEETGRTVWFVDTTVMEETKDEPNESMKRLLATMAHGEPGWAPDGKPYRPFLMWSALEFSRFAFDLVAILNGTYQPGFISSLYASPIDPPPWPLG